LAIKKSIPKKIMWVRARTSKVKENTIKPNRLLLQKKRTSNPLEILLTYLSISP
jgi:hypothetical protein